MKQVLIRKGSVDVADVPAPSVDRAGVLVRVRHSCISPGTESAGVTLSGLPLYRRALRQPHHARRVLGLMREQGVARTLQRVRGVLDAGLPTGYSVAGRVIEVGRELADFSPGDLVACAGAGYANHAEVVSVPVNLVVPVPDGLGTAAASTVTLGAIALQGVRRANPTMGETFVVVGLGALGQLTAQLLDANGCRVIGVDIEPERLAIAAENGLDHGVDPALDDYVDRVLRLTGGFGADGVIVTAASSEHRVISEAMQACRKKGRVVLVGDVGLHLRREDLYKKELDFLISTSYGPGRYDPVYEEQGLDYPLPYVRWTENRNMEAYLDLLARGQLSVDNMLGSPHAIDDAREAFASLEADGSRPLMVLLEYDEDEALPERRVQIHRGRTNSGRIRVGIAGAGGFVQGTQLPLLVKLRSHFDVRAIMSRTGSNARAVATQYQAEYATTAYDELLQDPDLDLIMIGTRHDRHAAMALEALAAGKHVFVEKPLALSGSELGAIEEFFRTRDDPPLLMTGFNRRFSPGVRRIMEILADRTTPLMVSYRMNAGFLPTDHWVHGPEGGGRNLGEACHVYDLFDYLTSATVRSVDAVAARPGSKQWNRTDNFVSTVSFSDGSVCSLTYTALGARTHPKERMEIFADGMVVSLDNYQSVTVSGSRKRGWKSTTSQKGHMEELDALFRCLSKGGPWPIPLEQQIQATTIALSVDALLRD